MKILIITILATAWCFLVSCQTTRVESEPEPEPIAQSSTTEKSIKKSTKKTYTKKKPSNSSDYIKPQSEEAILKKIAESEQSTIPFTPPTTSFPSVPTIPDTSNVGNTVSSSIPFIPPTSSSASDTINIAPSLPSVSSGSAINQDSVLE